MKYSKDQINKVVEIISKHQPVKADRIAEMIGYPTDNQQTQTRGIITAAISAGHLITSHTAYGYSIATTLEEVEAYIKSLDSRIEKTKERKRTIMEAWNKKSGA